MILRTTSIRLERMIAVAFLVVGAAAVIAGFFSGFMVSFGGGGIALVGLWILLSQSGDETRAEVLEGFRKELAEPSPEGQSKRDTSAGPEKSGTHEERKDA